MNKIAVDGGVGDLGKTGDQLVPQGRHLGGIFIDMVACLLQRGGHRYDAGDVLSAGPLAPLLSAALDDVGQRNTLTGVQQSHALGTVEFVGGQRQHIDVLCLHVNVKVACRLYGVSVEQDAFLFAYCADLRNGHNGANLVVGIHNGNQTGILSDRICHLRRGNGAAGANVQQLNVKALLFQLFQGVQHGVVLKSGGNNVLFAFSLANAGGGDNGLVVGLAAAGGEGDLPGLTAETFCHGLAGLLQSFRRLLADSVQAGRISIISFHIGQHRVDGCAAHFGGSRVICIDLHGVPPESVSYSAGIAHLSCRLI